MSLAAGKRVKSLPPIETVELVVRSLLAAVHLQSVELRVNVLEYQVVEASAESACVYNKTKNLQSKWILIIIMNKNLKLT